MVGDDATSSVLKLITLEERQAMLTSNLSSKQFNFVYNYLSAEKLRVIDGTEAVEPEDYYFVARARYLVEKHRNLAERLNCNYSIQKEFFQEYLVVQRRWMKKETSLLELQLGRKPTPCEIISDFSKNENGLVFRIFSLLKNPEKFDKTNGTKK